MNSFMKGLLVGVGIGLLVAPMRGEEMRTMLGERFGEIKARLPENEQLNMYRQQLSDRVTQTAGTLKDYAQQAASTVKSTADSLSSTAQQAGSTLKQSGQDLADTTKRAVNSTKSDMTS
ncbi:MAG TPA: YtxH domain-containing protein [Ktedonobacteraceae bacterium]|nr:YtxH domain-containing protein [Ktedonobacteraceae bacterium]